jgi:benzodiazapine receptor
MNKEIRWWQVVLATIVVSTLGALSTGLGKKNQQKLYERKLKQAPWSPPAKLFGPAWSVNNYFLLKALKHLLESDSIPGKRKLLIRQVAIWVIFLSFGYVYFQKKSPILAAIWTLADAWLATSSFANAIRSNKRLAFNYLPLLGWTGYAGTVALYQALKNPDPVFRIPAVI